ncbi:uncharacterized protein BJ212DRAFT_1392910 [Suillus subaureus]|uniref:Uncharacterized protein n=1 Tax=Suillus subaureus TaxID=48587 RepID=A0A9P7DXC6_9AGAM|nr:uncharacterized protein BJ212DRAFT_1392910 [Suillus subaureus]KAG1805229.1 hypothetical protein BJ212DRAFT_1392910 [Suillus subaureus]
MSKQTQRIALLDELNSTQTENGNLRVRLRAKKSITTPSLIPTFHLFTVETEVHLAVCISSLLQQRMGIGMSSRTSFVAPWPRVRLSSEQKIGKQPDTCSRRDSASRNSRKSRRTRGISRLWDATMAETGALYDCEPQPYRYSEYC